MKTSTSREIATHDPPLREVFGKNRLKNVTGACGKTAALNSNRFSIFAIGEAPFIIGNFHTGESLRFDSRHPRIHYKNISIPNVSEIVKTNQVSSVLGGLRGVDGGVLQDIIEKNLKIS